MCWNSPLVPSSVILLCISLIKGYQQRSPICNCVSLPKHPPLVCVPCTPLLKVVSATRYSRISHLPLPRVCLSYVPFFSLYAYMSFLLAGILFAYAALGESVSDKSVDHQQVINKALISFLLTVVNIICIFFAAILMFKIKEIAPIPGKTALFKHDIKHARQLLHSLVTETSAQEQQPVSTVVHATLPLPQLIQRHRRSRTGESPISPAYSKTQLAFQRPGELLAFGGTFSANDRRWGPAPINIMLSSAYSTTPDLRQAQRPHIVSIFDKPGAGGGGMTASNDMSNNTTISNNNTGGVGGNLKGNVQLNVKTNEQL